MKISDKDTDFTLVSMFVGCIEHGTHDVQSIYRALKIAIHVVHDMGANKPNLDPLSDFIDFQLWMLGDSIIQEICLVEQCGVSHERMVKNVALALSVAGIKLEELSVAFNEIRHSDHGKLLSQNRKLRNQQYKDEKPESLGS